jgi:hypothetical protein
MVKLRQCDPRWAKVKIGNSSSTICAYGCLITSLSMLSDYYKCYKNPEWMAKNLKFLNDLLIWKSIDGKLCFKFKWRYYKHEKEIFTKAINSNPRTAVVLNVSGGRHWVVATRKIPLGYWTVDPLTGKSTFYRDSSVVGGAVLEK